MTVHRLTLVLLLAIPLVPAAAAESPTFDPASLLPPILEWDGASRALIAPADDPWRTPAESTGFSETPTYDETIAWLRRLADTTDKVQLVSIGESWERRTLWMVVVSDHGATSPAEFWGQDKPVLLAQAGIHSGEIDGKDAGLMLLRDLTFGPLQGLLAKTHFLFIPILNVDGHERVSPFSRINQRGPRVMGWRTNARNLNLNRDYAKLDTPEIRAVVEVLDRWRPDLYLDLHVTDGIHMQHDITWGFNGSHGHSPAIGAWLESRLDPMLVQSLEAMGHLPGPHVFAIDRNDLSQGLLAWEGGPRYSDGYGGSRHVATVLVENHSLKPFEQRVLGTRVFLEAALEALATHGQELRQATRTDRQRRWEKLAVGFTWDREPQPEPFEFLAVEWQSTPSAISGSEWTRWTGERMTLEVPLFRTTRSLGEVTVPIAYWVPAAWSDVIERLAAHGIELELLDSPREVTVETYRLAEPQWADEPYEGRMRVSAQTTPLTETRVFQPGSARVPTAQPLGALAVLLLEPLAPDSFLQWGFFNPVFQRTEYAETYVLEPLALQMLERDPELGREFERLLAEDPEFAADPRRRLAWFYERSPIVDLRWRLYPVGRELP